MHSFKSHLTCVGCFAFQKHFQALSGQSRQSFSGMSDIVRSQKDFSFVPGRSQSHSSEINIS